MKAFANYHPAVLLLYFLSVLLVGMFVTNPVIQPTMLLGAVLFCIMCTPSCRSAGGIAFYVSMFLLVAVTNPLFSHNGVTPLFYLNGNPVTLEAFVYGAAIAVMVVGVMLWCRCYSAVMTSDKFLYLFGLRHPQAGAGAVHGAAFHSDVQAAASQGQPSAEGDGAVQLQKPCGQIQECAAGVPGDDFVVVGKRHRYFCVDEGARLRTALAVPDSPCFASVRRTASSRRSACCCGPDTGWDGRRGRRRLITIPASASCR